MTVAFFETVVDATLLTGVVEVVVVTAAVDAGVDVVTETGADVLDAKLGTESDTPYEAQS